MESRAVFADSTVPGCIVVYVDAWAAYGGSLFVDSPNGSPAEPHRDVTYAGSALGNGSAG